MGKNFILLSKILLGLVVGNAVWTVDQCKAGKGICPNVLCRVLALIDYTTNKFKRKFKILIDYRNAGASDGDLEYKRAKSNYRNATKDLKKCFLPSTTSLDKTLIVHPCYLQLNKKKEKTGFSKSVDKKLRKKKEQDFLCILCRKNSNMPLFGYLDLLCKTDKLDFLKEIEIPKGFYAKAGSEEFNKTVQQCNTSFISTVMHYNTTLGAKKEFLERTNTLKQDRNYFRDLEGAFRELISITNSRLGVGWYWNCFDLGPLGYYNITEQPIYLGPLGYYNITEQPISLKKDNIVGMEFVVIIEDHIQKDGSLNPLFLAPFALRARQLLNEVLLINHIRESERLQHIILAEEELVLAKKKLVLAEEELANVSSDTVEENKHCKVKAHCEQLKCNIAENRELYWQHTATYYVKNWNTYAITYTDNNLRRAYGEIMGINSSYEFKRNPDRIGIIMKKECDRVLGIMDSFKDPITGGLSEKTIQSPSCNDYFKHTLPEVVRKMQHIKAQKNPVQDLIKDMKNNSL